VQLILNHTVSLEPWVKSGFRRPGSMIAKLVDDEIKKIAKKENKSVEAMRENLLKQGRALLNGK